MTTEQQPFYIDRPPRIQPELPFDEIEIPGPPEKPRAGLERLFQIGLPLLTIMGYIGISALGGRGRSPAMLIPMALSVVGSVSFGIWSFLKERRELKQQQKDYAARITEMSKEMTQHHDQQRRFYRYNYPDTRSVFRIVQSARDEAERTHRMLAGEADSLARPVSQRGEARLWERRTSDDDFGVIRLGMGTLPSTVIYKYKEGDDDDSMLAREAQKLEADSLFVSDIPVILNMRQRVVEDDTDDEKEAATERDETPRTPVTHALSIAGDHESVYEYTRAMLAHFAVFHAPSDARLYLLAPSREPWLWTDHLPHCQDDDQNKLRCFVDEIEDDERKQHFADDEGDGVEQFLEGIRKELSQRKIRMDDNEGGEVTGDPTLPLTLVVVDLLDATFDPGSPMNDLQSDAAISILIEQGAALGGAVIFLVPERSKAPSSCKAVLEIEKTTPATNSKKERDLQQLHFRYAEVGVNSFRYIGKADGLTDADNMSWLAQNLAEVRMRQGFGANLTNAVMFLELMGVNSLDEQLAATTVNWPASTDPEHATFLRAKIGRMSGNKPRSLVFSAKKDGVHGMVAGSTGSGKSELLISLIASMAVNYDPTMLNFVLVDYKGGGAFKEFVQLPHCVDIITNLEGDGVTRMFTAINSEMKRRQKLNADTGTKDIVDYHQQGYHLTREPYPFLFIIIDEFAEMIADRSEYKSELESITRVGRAQGVTLILAAQRPSGVTDQMRSNIKFRICLRVETSGESREMLRRGDAAFLPSGLPGRGYLQVGNDEIELIQVAYTGEKYMDPNRPNPPVIWPGRPSAPSELQEEPQELYKVLIDRLDGIARRTGVAEQRAPWPGFLPTDYALNSPLTTVPDSQDPSSKAITSMVYLQQIDLYLLGKEQDGPLTLNPYIDRWLNGNPGWVEDLDWEQYAMRPVVGLIDDPYAARQLPLTVDLRKGHVVIFGASGWGKTVFMRTLVTSLAATHSPNQVQIYILDLGGRNLDILDELPHVGAVILPDAEGYEERTEQLMRELESTIEERKRTLGDAGISDLYAYNTKYPDATIPAIVLIIDNFLEFRETFEIQDDSIEGAVDKFVSMARQARTYGVHFVISTTLINALPTQVFSLFTERMTLKMTDPTDYRTIVGGYVADISDTPGRGYIKIGQQPLGFQIAMPLLLPEGASNLDGDVHELNQLIHRMKEYAENSDMTFAEPIRVDALPRGVLLKHMLATEYQLEQDATFLPNLKAVAKQNWADSEEADLADWLNVTIGVISGNRPRPLELEAKKDGVHGLIAGGTGSGKSELLMTLIVGLALHYDPSILNFVLVDYKGGGAFKPFEELPHCVDIITNLNKSAVKRMFTAINAEMQRRQALNAETNTKDIVEYRAKGLHKTRAPYPHLFIIIDEYAEMITDNPEFRDELDSITRVGRAQGVNLLLASQRPTGVSDQMRANIKFRICLRVEGVDTSREMLRRNDAAFLPNGMPGRGYLQVGNENIELMQVAYTGESVDYVELDDDQEPPKFYDVVVEMAQHILAENGAPMPRTPWPPFLETALEMDAPLIEEYLDDAFEPAMTLGRTERLAVNPFVADWLNAEAKPHPNPPQLGRGL